MSKELNSLFKILDGNLSELAQSNSSIEFADHVRKHFDSSIDALNSIKKFLHIDNHSKDYYFDREDEDERELF